MNCGEFKIFCEGIAERNNLLNDGYHYEVVAHDKMCYDVIKTKIAKPEKIEKIEKSETPEKSEDFETPEKKLKK